MNKVLIRVFESLTSMKRGIHLSFSLSVFFHRHTKLEYIKISFVALIAKFINMLVMFMPLKLMFVLTGEKNIEFFSMLENHLGRTLYISLILLLLAIFYAINITLSFYSAKLIKRQKCLLDLDLYQFLDQKVKRDKVIKTLPTFCQMLSDSLLILSVSILLFVFGPLLSLSFIFILIVFSLIYEQWVFSEHETNLIKKLAIDKSNLVQMLSMLMFFVMFFVLTFFVILNDVSAIIAILMLLLIRLANNSYKSYISSHIKLRRFYPL